MCPLSIGQGDIDKLRQRGLVVEDSTGVEGLLISVQFLDALPDQMTRSEWRQRLEERCREMADALREHGATVLPETLSTSAQTVEVFVPLNRLDETIHCELSQDVRFDLVISHRVTTR